LADNALEFNFDIIAEEIRGGALDLDFFSFGDLVGATVLDFDGGTAVRPNKTPQPNFHPTYLIELHNNYSEYMHATLPTNPTYFAD